MALWTSKSAGETKALGAALACCLQAGDVVVLNGGLGAGKTQLVQGVAAALGVAGEVTSPTFTILLTYECVYSLRAAALSFHAETPSRHSACSEEALFPQTLNHFDLYRLESAEELEDIGYWEVLESDGASFIEWGDKFPEAMPDDYLELSIVGGLDGVRSISAHAHGVRSDALLANWCSRLEAAL